MKKENTVNEPTKAMPYDALLSVVFGKLLCKVGWHKWSYKLKDAIDEFGALPLDSRMPKTAKCDRCGINYR